LRLTANEETLNPDGGAGTLYCGCVQALRVCVKHSCRLLTADNTHRPTATEDLYLI